MRRDDAKKVALKIALKMSPQFGFGKWIFPRIQNVRPEDVPLLDQIVDVQPMGLPSASVFYIDIIVSGSRWEVFKSWFQRVILRRKTGTIVRLEKKYRGHVEPHRPWPRA